jgi:hypothetical protein
MDGKKTFVFLLLACAAAGVAWQRNKLSELHRLNEALLADTQEADRLSAENQELQRLRAAGDRANDPAELKRELLKVRNQVRQLRGQVPEIARLQADNERLNAEIRSGKFTQRRLRDMEGFVAREKWANAGFTTPEATAQSVFWALREENLAQLAECVNPRLKEYFLTLLQPGQESQQANAMKEWQSLAKINGFRIAERHVQAEDMVTLGIQCVADGTVMQMRFRRYGNEWKWELF